MTKITFGKVYLSTEAVKTSAIESEVLPGHCCREFFILSAGLALFVWAVLPFPFYIMQANL
jgi:hypothetical protein